MRWSFGVTVLTQPDPFSAFARRSGFACSGRDFVTSVGIRGASYEAGLARDVNMPIAQLFEEKRRLEEAWKVAKKMLW